MGPIGPEQLAAWFTAHGAAMVLYARQWLDAASAEDVVQEVFLRMMSQGQPPRNVRAWLFTAVRNAAVNQLRSRRRRARHESARAAGVAEWFRPGVDDRIDARAAAEALAALPEQQREILVLRIWGQMTIQEAAGVAGQAISTAFRNYQAGLESLRKAMVRPCPQKTS